jgi:hypothetical protein
MKTIQLEIKDDYLDSILNFLKLLPTNVAQIRELSNDESEFSEELLSRVQEIKTDKVKTISRDELFDEI